jgi:DNA polymerase sigma
MSLPLSDVEEQTNSSNSFFHYIPSKNDHEQLQNNSNPDSSFYCIKNTQQYPFPPSSASASRPGNARTIFTIIPTMSQDTANKTNVRNQLAFSCEFRLNRRLFFYQKK